PYPWARSETYSHANCLSKGTEIAYLLFSTIVITGNLCTPAKFNPSWKSVWLEEPSHNVTNDTTFTFSIFAASATPTACGNCVVTGEEPVRIRFFFWPKCPGICRPSEFGSSALANPDSINSLGVIPNARTTPISR